MNIDKTRKIIEDLKPQVTLVAVTKNQRIEDVDTLYKLGVDQFGENKLQELIKKKEIYPNAKWHFIGRIQSNKIKDIVKHASLIHSVSELRYLQKINSEAEKLNKIQDVLLQLNIANEETKKGIDTTQFEYIIANQAQFPNVRIRGLMVMGNHTEDLSVIENTFKLAKQQYESIHNQYPHFSILSMGMSFDYKLAIECGSTMVRLGSVLF